MGELTAAAAVTFVYDDGGRQGAGLPPAALHADGRSGDCVVRAVALALAMPYKRVHRQFADQMREDEFCQRYGLSDPDGGVPPHITDGILRELGWRFTLNDQHTHGLPVLTMHDLPPGRYVLEFSERDPAQATREGRGAGHMTALVDGEQRDLFDVTDSPMWGWWST